ncbi:hypothetical protein JTE90_016886, partial [Oedothorax gibbosus]
AHVGYLGNELADELAGEAASLDGAEFILPVPSSFLKANLKSELLGT